MAFDFSDAVKRRVLEAAMEGAEYSAEVLGSPITVRKKIAADQYIRSRVIPYDVTLPLDPGRAFRTWGVEGGNAVNRLGSEPREAGIIEFPFQIFVTDDEIELHKRRQQNIKTAVKRRVQQVLTDFRKAKFFDNLALAVLANEDTDYPSAIFDAGTDPLTYDVANEALSFFTGSRERKVVACFIHVDWYTSLRTEARRVPEQGSVQWVTTASEQQKKYELLDIPLYSSPLEDTEGEKDYSEYTWSGLKFTENEEVRYRTYFVTQDAHTEYTGWAPSMKMLDTAPVPAGTAGYPANGQSSGVTWYLSLLHAGVYSIPKDGWDRIGIVQVLHGAPAAE